MRGEPTSQDHYTFIDHRFVNFDLRYTFLRSEKKICILIWIIEPTYCEFMRRINPYPRNARRTCTLDPIARGTGVWVCYFILITRCDLREGVYSLVILFLGVLFIVILFLISLATDFESTCYSYFPINLSWGALPSSAWWGYCIEIVYDKTIA